jgi:hypothetical protein
MGVTVGSTLGGIVLFSLIIGLILKLCRGCSQRIAKITHFPLPNSEPPTVGDPQAEAAALDITLNGRSHPGNHNAKPESVIDDEGGRSRPLIDMDRDRAGGASDNAALARIEEGMKQELETLRTQVRHLEARQELIALAYGDVAAAHEPPPDYS